MHQRNIVSFLNKLLYPDSFLAESVASIYFAMVVEYAMTYYSSLFQLKATALMMKMYPM